jgi:hypothetical protein
MLGLEMFSLIRGSVIGFVFSDIANSASNGLEFVLNSQSCSGVSY